MILLNIKIFLIHLNTQNKSNQLIINKLNFSEMFCYLNIIIIRLHLWENLHNIIEPSAL